MSIRIIKPTDGDLDIYGLTIFLAGSIEMGSAEDWQTNISERLEELDLNIDVFNPRRDSWDSSWKQEESNPEFNHQVNWEMNKLDRSDVIFMYFSPETKSPISLLELGLYADSGRIIVCCPDGFWRKGNVEIVCSRYRIPLYHNLDDAFGGLLTKIKTTNRI
jgi:hypothetical protein